MNKKISKNVLGLHEWYTQGRQEISDILASSKQET